MIDVINYDDDDNDDGDADVDDDDNLKFDVDDHDNDDDDVDDQFRCCWRRRCYPPLNLDSFIHHIILLQQNYDYYNRNNYI